MLIYAIIALLVLIFVTLAALVLTSPMRSKSAEPGELTPDALKNLALSLRKTTAVGRAPSRMYDKLCAARAYRRIASDDGAGVNLERCEIAFAEKYHAIAVKLSPKGYGALASLPHVGEARVLLLAKAFVASPSVCDDNERLKSALTEFVRYTPLTYAEIVALPVAFEAAAVAMWGGVARKLTEIGKARAFAEADSEVDKRRSRTEGYMHFFVKSGKRIDPRFAASGVSTDATATELAFSALTARLCERTDRVFALLGRLRSVFDPSFLLTLCPGRAVMESDNAFAVTDVASRHEYHARIAKLAARYSVPERSVAEAAVALARDRGRHFGEYLFDSPHLIKAKLAAKKPRKLPRFARTAAFATAVFSASAAIAVAAAVLSGMGIAAVAYAICCFFAFFPVAEYAAKTVAAILCSSRPCPRLSGAPLDEECRTVAVMPVFVADEKGAREAAERLLSVRAVNEREYVDYALLCDFKSADAKRTDDDAKLLGVLAEYEERGLKIFVRERVRIDGKWRARDRKRGAIADFNAYLLGEGDCFCKTSPLGGAVKYCIVIDEDNLLAPGAVRTAIDSIRHPLASKYDMLAFGAYADGGRAKTRYAQRSSGGRAAYARHSDLFYDLDGTAVFCGKGIYRTERFRRKTAVLDGKRLLSHDIAEGAVMSVGAADVFASEKPPEGPSADLARSYRWKRGDLMLLGLLGRIARNPVYAYVVLSNAFAVISPIATFALVAAFFATGSAVLGVAAAFACFAVPVASVAESVMRSAGSRASCVFVRAVATLVRAVENFALLPMRAANNALLLIACAVCAAFAPSKLTEWKTFASSGGESAQAFARYALPGAVLVAVFAAVFGANFAFSMWAAAYVAAATAVFSLAFAPVCVPKRVTSAHMRAAKEYAAKTYAYFAAMGGKLPCDNIQAYPPIGESKTVSPTDLGFWLIADVCAAECGLIAHADAATKACEKLALVARLQKWRGHLYNWYDREGNVVAPEYVSFVDSGNFVACARVARAFCKKHGGPDGEKIASELIANTDFGAFADKKKGLFARGFDAKRGEFDGWYDLIASEARLAVLLGCAATGSCAEWTALGRSRLGAVLPVYASWSGTAFEYLMPELFLRTPPTGELARSVRRATLKMRLRRCGKFWGISESGYYAFDKLGNYQYRAHGVDSLALSGANKHRVIAPYASALAASVAPNSAFANLARLRESGFFGKYGFYEAVDFSCGENTVYSYMTHHQGMILAAMTNVIGRGAIIELFSDGEDTECAEMLLYEPKSDVRAVRRIRQPFASCRKTQRFCFECNPSEMPSFWAASGGAYCCVADECGCGYSRFGDSVIGVFRGDPAVDEGAFGVFFDGDEAMSPTFAPLRRDCEAKAVFSTEGAHYASGDCTLDVCVPTGVGGELRRYRVFNPTDSVKEFTFVYYHRLAMMPRADYFAHPSFNDMFVETSFDGAECCIVAERVSREKKGGLYAAVRFFGGTDAIPDCDAAHFCDLPRGIYVRGERTGRTMSPCIGLSCKVSAPPRGYAEITAVSLFASDREGLDEKLAALGSDDFSEAARVGAADGGVLAKYFEGEKGARIFSEIAARLLRLPLPSSAVEARSKARARSAAVEEGKKTVVLKYGDCPDFSAWVKACTACALVGIDFLLVILYKEEDVYDATVRRRLVDECGISDLERLAFVRLIDVSADGETERGLLAGACVVGGECERPVFESGMRALKRPVVSPRYGGVAVECGTGGFDEKGDYIVASRPQKPYSNVVNLERGGLVVTENGGGFRWLGSAYFGKIGVWSNDFASDPPCEMFFVCENGAYERVDRLIKGGFVRHAPGATTFCSRVGTADWDVKKSVFGNGAFSATLVTAVSDDESPKRAFWIALPSLDSSDGSGFCMCEEDDGIIRAFNCTTRMSVYARCIGVSAKCVTDGAAICSRTGYGIRVGGKSPYPAIAFDIAAASGRSCEFAIVLSEDAEALRALTLEDVKQGIDETERYFRSLNPVEIDSKNALFDAFFNRWLCTQIYSSRIFGRCGYYQAGGALGARDILQDAAALIPIDPQRAKSIFLDVCAHQYEEGDVMHWWHPPRTGVRTKISDDKLFLPWFAAKWFAVTGDATLSETQCTFLKSPPLAGVAEARYETPDTASSATVAEHCDRAIANALAVGEHGLLKIGAGDWNDALNAIGTAGRGESVWLTMFAVRVLRDWAAAVGYEKGQSLLHEAQRLSDAVEKTFCDGRFARAFTDDGEWLGRDGGACALDLICQAWAVIANVGDCETKNRALDSAERLYDKDAGLVKLFDPPFDKTRYVGYISAYPRGVRENGGQYTHAAVWYLLALFLGGRDEDARRLLYDLCPSTAAEKYGAMRKGEPYVLSGDVYSADDKRGESGWSWYTGSAGWFYTVATQYAIGIVRSKGMIRIDKPRAFDPDKLTLRIRCDGTTYVVRYEKGDGDFIRSNGLSYLNCTEFRPAKDKGEVEIVRVYT